MIDDPPARGTAPVIVADRAQTHGPQMARDGTRLACDEGMPSLQPAHLHPDDAKGEVFAHRAAYREDPGREQDPLPAHRHRIAEADDDLPDPELDDDLASRADDDLFYADGPDA